MMSVARAGSTIRRRNCPLAPAETSAEAVATAGTAPEAGEGLPDREVHAAAEATGPAASSRDGEASAAFRSAKAALVAFRSAKAASLAAKEGVSAADVASAAPAGSREAEASGWMTQTTGSPWATVVVPSPLPGEAVALVDGRLATAESVASAGWLGAAEA